MRLLPWLLLFCIADTALAGDTLYARKVLRELCSEKCYGRGYLKNGLRKAEKYILAEIKSTHARPGFGASYTSSFHHQVNTFPGKCALSINGRKLKPGIDFIPHPASASFKGSRRLIRSDSSHFATADSSVRLSVKKKLTYSVGSEPLPYCAFEILSGSLPPGPESVEVSLQNRVKKRFESSNISCLIDGTSGTDSLILFTAHYDHLGGIGKKTWFPGANDNASGVSMLLNLIRHYSANPPRYTTVFVFFAGEEAGLLGSKHYVQHPPFDLRKIKFLLNLDLLGTGEEGIMVVNGAIHEQAFQLMKEINAEKNLLTGVRKRGKAANSDHYWFSEAGVPAFFIYTMGGRTAYHDVQDIEPGLPFTEYTDVFRLITEFASRL